MSVFLDCRPVRFCVYCTLDDVGPSDGSLLQCCAILSAFCVYPVVGLLLSHVFINKYLSLDYTASLVVCSFNSLRLICPVIGDDIAHSLASIVDDLDEIVKSS